MNTLVSTGMGTSCTTSPRPSSCSARNVSDLAGSYSIVGLWLRAYPGGVRAFPGQVRACPGVDGCGGPWAAALGLSRLAGANNSKETLDSTRTDR